MSEKKWTQEQTDFITAPRGPILVSAAAGSGKTASVVERVITRLCEDRALLCNELAAEIKALSQQSTKNIIIVGDGTDIFYPFVEGLPHLKKSAPQNRFQNAVGVGLCSIEDFKTNNTISATELLPFYLRLPQAERELKAKEEEKCKLH